MTKNMLMMSLTLLLTATNLVAADLYVGAGLGGNADAGTFRHNIEEFSDAGGRPWMLFAGWSLSPHLAVEVSRRKLGNQSCCVGVSAFGFDSDVDGFTAEALGKWPIQRFTPFVKAGLLAWEEKGNMITFGGAAPGSADGTDLLIGAGVDFDLPNRFSVRAEWEQYDFSGTSDNAFWASLIYRF